MSGKQSAILGSDDLKKLRKRIDQLEKSLLCPHFWEPIVKQEFGVKYKALKCIHCNWIKTEYKETDKRYESLIKEEMKKYDNFTKQTHGKTAENCIYSSFKRVLIASNGKRMITSSKREYCINIEREDLHDYKFYMCRREPENCPFWKADERWISNDTKKM